VTQLALDLNIPATTNIDDTILTDSYAIAITSSPIFKVRNVVTNTVQDLYTAAAGYYD